MKFTISTKPFASALDLAVVSNNVTKFNKLSCLAQLTVDGKQLTLNLEADRISTEVRFKGAPDPESAKAVVFVDCMLLKQLISTVESGTVILEFTESGLVIHSGSSKFTLPKLLDDAELELKKPNISEYFQANGVDLDRTGWKFVKDCQMYALSMSFAYPVYTKVWVGENGGVIVGDMNKSLFTYAKKSNLGKTCLLHMSIVNLFNSLPEGAKIIPGKFNYLIHVKAEGYEYVTEFKPQYEEDEDMGSYHSDIVLEELKHPDYSVAVNPSLIAKYLNQALLLATTKEDTITFKLGNGVLSLCNNNVVCNVNVQGTEGHEEVECVFLIEDLQSVITKYEDELINIGPVFDEEGCKGIVVYSKDLTTVLGGVD